MTRGAITELWETLKAVSDLWHVRLKKLRHDISIQGSPERSVFRVVIEDENGKLFVLEQVPLKFLDLKRKIAGTLDFLSEKNLAHIQPYLADKKGKHVIKYKNGFWQMIPFVPNVSGELCKDFATGRRAKSARCIKTETLRTEKAPD